MDPNLLTTSEKLTWFADNKDLFLVLLGGFCAAFGGFVIAWYQAKKARQIKIAETIGMQQVDAHKKALAFIRELNGVLLQGTYEDGIKFMTEHNQWFMDNTLLLPHKFRENWISISHHLYKADEMHESQAEMTNNAEKQKTIEELLKLKEYMKNLGRNALEAIQKESRLQQVKIQHPPKDEQKQ